MYIAPSWFDGQPAIILDYSKTSLIAHKVRDEIREVSPGTFLGIVYYGTPEDHQLRAPVQQLRTLGPVQGGNLLAADSPMTRLYQLGRVAQGSVVKNPVETRGEADGPLRW